MMTNKLLGSQTVKSHDYRTLRRVLAHTFHRQPHDGVAHGLSVGDADVDGVVADVEALHGTQRPIHRVNVKQTTIGVVDNCKDQPIGRVVVRRAHATDNATREDVVATNGDGRRQRRDDRRRTTALHDAHRHRHVRVQYRSTIVEHSHREMVLAVAMSPRRRTDHPLTVDVELVAVGTLDVVVERRPVGIQVGIGNAQSEDASTKTSVRLTTQPNIQTITTQNWKNSMASQSENASTGKPVSMYAHMKAHINAKMDRQVKNAIPPAAHRMGSRGIRIKHKLQQQYKLST